jgi:hypothetical protein
LLPFLLLVSLPLQATTTRVINLGGIDDLIKDESNIFLYPADVVLYPNTAIAELGEIIGEHSIAKNPTYPLGGQSLGGLITYYRRPSLGVLGGFLNRGAPTTDITNLPIQPDERVEAFYGNRLGSQWAFGLHVSEAYRYLKNSDLANQRGVRKATEIRTIDLGLRWGNVNGFSWDFTWGNGFADFSSDSTSTRGDSTVSLALVDQGRPLQTLRTRFTLPIFPLVNAVPFLQYSFADYGSVTRQNGVFFSRTTSTHLLWGGGVGANIEITDNGRVVVGAVVNRERHDVDTFNDSAQVVSSNQDEISDVPLLFLGYEARLKPWFTWRVGGTKGFHVEKHVTRDRARGSYAEEVTKESPFDFTLGFGIRGEKMDLDFLFNEKTPYVYAFMFTTTSEIPIYRISATYHF